MKVMRDVSLKMHKVMLTALATLGIAGFVGLSNPATANASSKVNDYIASKNYKPVKVTKSIWSGFPKYKYRHGKGKPEGVVVHETANPSSTIYNEIAYMKRNYNNAFVHSFVDASNIINIANTDYLSWGVGYPGNARFIQFEQIEVHSKSAFAHEIANAAWYTAYLLKEYNLKPNDAAYDGKGTVWSHGSVASHLGGSTHTDPVGYYASAGKKYFGQKYTMAAFYQMVKKYYNAMGSTNHTKLTAATYTSVNQQAKLSSKYTKYYLYNHVKGSNKNAKRQSWSKISPKVGKTYYIDMTAKKSTGSMWYRIKPSKNSSKRYWVWSGNLTSIQDVTTTATATSASTSSASDSSAATSSSSVSATDTSSSSASN